MQHKHKQSSHGGPWPFTYFPHCQGSLQSCWVFLSSLVDMCSCMSFTGMSGESINKQRLFFKSASVLDTWATQSAGLAHWEPIRDFGIEKNEQNVLDLINLLLLLFVPLLLLRGQPTLCGAFIPHFNMLRKVLWFELYFAHTCHTVPFIWTSLNRIHRGTTRTQKSPRNQPRA